jgi:hypothetical protein
MNALSCLPVIHSAVRSLSDVWELQIRQKRPREFVAGLRETHERGPLRDMGLYGGVRRNERHSITSTRTRCPAALMRGTEPGDTGVMVDRLD